MACLGYILLVRWNASFLHSSVSEGAFVFVKMSLPNVLNVTMEIKCYLLTLIKHLPSFLLSWVNGQNRVSSWNFQRLRNREDWFDSKLKLSLGICSTARTRGCRGALAHPFAWCSQPHKVQPAPHQSFHHFSHQNWLLAVFQVLQDFLSLSPFPAVCCNSTGVSEFPEAPTHNFASVILFSIYTKEIFVS